MDWDRGEVRKTNRDVIKSCIRALYKHACERSSLGYLPRHTLCWGSGRRFHLQYARACGKSNKWVLLSLYYNQKENTYGFLYEGCED